MTMSWLGIDIGGANLKAADGCGWARSEPFALWRDPAGLAQAICRLIDSGPAADRVAVTVTGELCDCFRTKAEGVRQILQSVVEASRGHDVRVYLTDGRLVLPDEARGRAHLAAASNWHALARFAGRFIEDGRGGLLIDIGSTTTDLVPLAKDYPCSTALTDTQRLLAGELVYTGVSRTPVCAVVDTLPFRGNQCPVATEVFATTADAYVLLGEVSERVDATWTADGRPLTGEFARERLARMICADRTQFSPAAALDAARAIRDAQIVQLRRALDQVIGSRPTPPECFVVSGSGEFLARSLIGDRYPVATVISLAERLGPGVSECAPAHALAVLASTH
ncbi:MAG: hydantoinase/oxoprolinase family protein [Pirellulales bacterium]